MEDRVFEAEFSTNEQVIFNGDFGGSTQVFGGDLGGVMNIGTTNYPELSNKPQINGHTLVGDLDSHDLGLMGLMASITPQEIDDLLFGV